ncbi:hypothetical protein [Arthrobacter sp. YN]|nr:hypothetical protein [Arthrobacter sp. YN]
MSNVSLRLIWMLALLAPQRAARSDVADDCPARQGRWHAGLEADGP